MQHACAAQASSAAPASGGAGQASTSPAAASARCSSSTAPSSARKLPSRSESPDRNTIPRLQRSISQSSRSSDRSPSLETLISAYLPIRPSGFRRSCRSPANPVPCISSPIWRQRSRLDRDPRSSRRKRG